ncbi:hypothetical protein [Leuconostoc citreum]
MSRSDETIKQIEVKVKTLKQKLAPVIKVIDFIDVQLFRPYLMYLGCMMLPVLMSFLINFTEIKITAIHVTAKQMQQLIHYQRLFCLSLLLIPLLAVFVRLVGQLIKYLKGRKVNDRKD